MLAVSTLSARLCCEGWLFRFGEVPVTPVLTVERRDGVEVGLGSEPGCLSTNLLFILNVNLNLNYV